MSSSPDIVIVGGGVAGGVLATLLGRAGLDVVLIERKTFPRRKVCGCCLNARAIAGLAAAGLRDVIAALRPVEHRAFSLWANGRNVDLPMPRGCAISRAALDQALLVAATEVGVQIHQPASAVVLGVTSNRRLVRVSTESPDSSPQSTELAANVVIAADGLGHPSLRQLPELSSRLLSEVAVDSRLGAGCELPNSFTQTATSPVPEHAFRDDAIHMLVSRDGYVGLTRLETGRWNVAAAFQRDAVKHNGGLGQTARRIVDAASICSRSVTRTTSRTAGSGVRAELDAFAQALAEADWSGTPELTRTAPGVAFERLFLIGDAAGYVEPFTGEGMATAIDSALAVAGLVVRGVTNWETSLAQEWIAAHRDIARRRSWLCRGLARLLRSPLAVRGSMAALHHWPGLATPLINMLNEPQPVPVFRRP